MPAGLFMIRSLKHPDQILECSAGKSRISPFQARCRAKGDLKPEDLERFKSRKRNLFWRSKELRPKEHMTISGPQVKEQSWLISIPLHVVHEAWRPSNSSGDKWDGFYRKREGKRAIP